MSDPLWEINPRTQVKHKIIKNYLNAWLPIMSSYEQRILFFDGFSGPGEYKNGEDGSPVIALKTALEHQFYKIKNTEIVWLFCDNKEECINYLKHKIHSEIQIPDKWKINCFPYSFAETADKILSWLEEQESNLAPSLVVIDPFGFTGFTIDLIKRLMINPKCEVIVNFMYESINRFLPLHDHVTTFNELFGTTEWQSIKDIRNNPQERAEQLRSLYTYQLKEAANIDYVRSFELRRGNRVSNYIFFGTNAIIGLEKMTDTMWTIDPSGNYSITDKTYGNNVLIQPQPDWNQLQDILLEKLSKKSIEVNKLLNAILVHIGFRKAGVKENVLKPLEKQNKIQITQSPRQRKYAYPAGTKIKFL